MRNPSQVVSLEEQRDVGLIRIDNPPVNALNQDVRAGLAEEMAIAARNPQLKVLLIVSNGELFSAGADINEFDRALAGPSLQTVQAAIEEAADIDVVWTSGYGFPRHLGGPMFCADSLGLRRVAERIRFYHEKLCHYWRPAALVEKLASANSSFEEWDRQKA